MLFLVILLTVAILAAAATPTANLTTTAAAQIQHCALAAGRSFPAQFLVSGVPPGEFDAHIAALKLASTAGLLTRHWSFGDFFGYSVRFDALRECEEFLAFAFAGADAAASGGASGGGGAAYPRMTFNGEFRLNGVRASAAVEEVVDFMVPWGLDRIDQRALPLDQRFVHPKDAGANVDIYVVDTGVQVDHEQFEGRAVWGANVRENTADTDENGHGTHVAGVAAGKTFGVARAARIIAVKVLDGEGGGSYADLIDGLNWVVQNVKKPENAGRVAVINTSIQGEVSEVVNEAVRAVTSLGIHFVSAAGNSNEDGCLSSPAAVSKGSSLITVGAIDPRDQFAEFSNYGGCVSILAPGVAILSSYIGDNDSTQVLSGTSMASPFVTGVVATYLGLNSTLAPAAMKALLLGRASGGVAAGALRATANRVLYLGA